MSPSSSREKVSALAVVVQQAGEPQRSLGRVHKLLKLFV